MEKLQEIEKICFINFSKAFDFVESCIGGCYEKKVLRNITFQTTLYPTKSKALLYSMKNQIFFMSLLCSPAD